MSTSRLTKFAATVITSATFLAGAAMTAPAATAAKTPKVTKFTLKFGPKTTETAVNCGGFKSTVKARIQIRSKLMYDRIYFNEDHSGQVRYKAPGKKWKTSKIRYGDGDQAGTYGVKTLKTSKAGTYRFRVRLFGPLYNKEEKPTYGAWSAAKKIKVTKKQLKKHVHKSVNLAC